MGKHKSHESFECDHEDCGHVSDQWFPVCPKCKRGRMYVSVADIRPLKKDPKDPYVEVNDEE